MSIECNQRLYFEHYMKHTYYVVLAWKEIQDTLINQMLIDEDEFQRINHQIVWHDSSKVSKEEWLPYARKFYSNQGNDELVKEEFRKAVLCHKKHNLHHFETLRNYSGSDYKCYIIEMVCDYIAMGWEFGKDIFTYYEENQSKIDLPSLYQEYLNQVLNALRQSSISSYLVESITQKRMVYLG